MITLRLQRIGNAWYTEGSALGSLPYYFNDFGQNDLIERIAAEVPNPENGFKLSVSAQAFQGHKLTLERQESDSSGYWYFCRQLKLLAWIGRELQAYYPEFPERLYLDYAPLKRGEVSETL